MGKRVVITLIVIILSVSGDVRAKPFSARVNIHGGITKSKSLSLWEIHRYKDTVLPRRRPLCYAPWRTYLAICQNVEVTDRNDMNCLIIHADLAKIVHDDAVYNKKFARKFPSKDIRKIYRYCSRTKYVPHTKTARDVFSKRQGDCAGISAAFYVLCRVKRIPVRYVIGWAYGYCHAWNRVKINKKWYWVDCTLKEGFSRELWDDHSIMEKW